MKSKPPSHIQCRSAHLPLVNKEQKAPPKKSFSMIVKEDRFLTKKEKEILRNQLKSGAPISIETFSQVGSGHQMGCVPQMSTEIVFWEK